MPESRRRRRKQTPPPPQAWAGESRSSGSGQWVPITGSALSIIGIAWIVTFYVAGSSIPIMSDVGNWNLLIGMGFIVAGFLVFTRWE